MQNYDIVKNAICKKTQAHVPYCIRFTWEFIEKFSDDILKRYANEKILKLKEHFSKSLLIDFAIGNSVVCLPVPWWEWDSSQTEFKNEVDIPHFNFRTFGKGSYEILKKQIEAVNEVGNYYVTAPIYGSYIEKFQLLRGIENSLADMAGDIDGSRKILDFILRKNIVMLENIVNVNGLDGILLGSDWGSQRGMLISPDCWREMIKPGEQAEYNLIKNAGKDVWVHSCGDITPIIPDLVEMGVDVLNPVQPECMDIYALKNNYGDKLTFWGGISTQQTLPNGTPQEVKEETRRVIGYMAKNGGYIVAPAQEIQIDVPLENVFALIDTVKELKNEA